MVILDYIKEIEASSNIVPFLGIDGPGTLAGRIAMWHGKGSHAKIFDNAEDTIDLDRARVFGFKWQNY